MRPLILALVILAGASAAHADVTGKPRVIDGDTIEIAGERIRLHGIDAPEAKQTCTDKDGKEWRCGQDATFALANLIGDHWITCWGDNRDRYGRLIAVCYAGDHDLNAKMVLQGWALAYRRYSTDYVPEEAEAKAARQGLWRGMFTPPWDWRRGQRSTPQASAQGQSSRCPIKGNISRSGERIYHVPGGQYYDRTKVSQGKGERWFCSEEEARAAGWRRTRR